MRKWTDKYGTIRYTYTEEEKKEREKLFDSQKYKGNDDSWGGQGTVAGQSNYGKFGDGGQ